MLQAADIQVHVTMRLTDRLVVDVMPSSMLRFNGNQFSSDDVRYAGVQ